MLMSREVCWRNLYDPSRHHNPCRPVRLDRVSGAETTKQTMNKIIATLLLCSAVLACSKKSDPIEDDILTGHYGTNIFNPDDHYIGNSWFAGFGKHQIIGSPEGSNSIYISACENVVVLGENITVSNKSNVAIIQDRYGVVHEIEIATNLVQRILNP